MSIQRIDRLATGFQRLAIAGGGGLAKLNGQGLRIEQVQPDETGVRKLETIEAAMARWEKEAEARANE